MSIKRLICAIGAALILTSCGTQLNSSFLMSGGQKLAQAATLTDEQMAAYVAQTVTQLDKENTILPETDAYVKRVRRMTKGLTEVDGTPLNFQVYKTNDVNAFACADGSVRIYSGLLDVMSDDEALGVIGHEIGHVAMRHTRKQFQRALMTSALLFEPGVEHIPSAVVVRQQEGVDVHLRGVGYRAAFALAVWAVRLVAFGNAHPCFGRVGEQITAVVSQYLRSPERMGSECVGPFADNEAVGAIFYVVPRY